MDKRNQRNKDELEQARKMKAVLRVLWDCKSPGALKKE